jgi:hypothetical protein
VNNEIEFPVWACPDDTTMDDETFNFAIIAQDIIHCMNIGFTRRDYVSLVPNRYCLQAIHNWNIVEARLAGKPEPEVIVGI